MKSITKTIVVILATMIISLICFGVSAAPKYVTVCKIYGNEGNAVECKLIPNPLHVKPSVTWSSYRMKKEGFTPIKTDKIGR